MKIGLVGQKFGLELMVRCDKCRRFLILQFGVAWRPESKPAYVIAHDQKTCKSCAAFVGLPILDRCDGTPPRTRQRRAR